MVILHRINGTNKCKYRVLMIIKLKYQPFNHLGKCMHSKRHFQIQLSNTYICNFYIRKLFRQT